MRNELFFRFCFLTEKSFDGESGSEYFTTKRKHSILILITRFLR